MIYIQLTTDISRKMQKRVALGKIFTIALLFAIILALSSSSIGASVYQTDNTDEQIQNALVSKMVTINSNTTRVLDGTCNLNELECSQNGNCFCDVDENELLQFDWTLAWNPPSNLPMCIWAEPATLPVGAICPDAEGIGGATMTCTWTPDYCQAADHEMLFWISTDCDTIWFGLGLDIAVNNVNRLPIIQATPAGPIETDLGEIVHIEVSATDLDNLECTDAINKDVITLTQTAGPGLFVPNGNGIADYDWTTDIPGLTIVTFSVDDGKFGSDDTTVNINVNTPNYMVHHDVPFFETETFSSAASAKMILGYLGNSLSQTEIYDYGIAFNDPANTTELDPKGMVAALDNFDPPFYNFSIASFSSDDIAPYMRDIAHWMDFDVHEYYDISDPTGPAKVPPAVPLFGSYDTWVVVNGFISDADPLPENNNPHITPDFNIIGFFLTDPNTSGIGVDTFITGEEARITYFQTIVSNDIYNGRFVQVAEPPAVVSTATVTIKESKSTIAGEQLVGFLKTSERTELNSDSRSPTNAVDIIPEELFNDPDFANAIEGSVEGKSVSVFQTDGTGYYIVTFEKEGLTSVALTINKRAIVEAVTWVKNPVEYSWNSDEFAIEKIEDYLEGEIYSIGSVRLVWNPKDFATSAFKPYHEVIVNGIVFETTYYVSHDGEVFEGPVKRRIYRRLFSRN